MADVPKPSIELLVDCLRRSSTIQEALDLANEAVGTRLTPDGLQKRLKRAGQPPASKLLALDPWWKMRSTHSFPVPHDIKDPKLGDVEIPVHWEEPEPDNFFLDRTSVMRDKDGKTAVEWKTFKRKEAAQWEDIKSAIATHVAEYVRAAEPVERPKTTDADLLTAYPLGDPHIGMLAWAGEVGKSFDLKIAERELCECFRQLVARSPSSKQAIVCNLGDFWHAQDDSQRTPKSGNKLDVDGRFGKVGNVGLAIMRTLVDAALTKHEFVTVRSIPGNHDPNSAFWIPQYLKAVYENDPRVKVEDGFAPYQYDSFGKVLLGWCHGDGAKFEDLGEIMAADVPELWGAAAHRYWNTGHVHHWSTKELRGCVVDTHRTLAPQDAWHNHSGYRSGQALKAITYHRLHGLDSVAVVGIERVRAALNA